MSELKNNRTQYRALSCPVPTLHYLYRNQSTQERLTGGSGDTRRQSVDAGLAGFGCQCCHLTGKGDPGLGTCVIVFPFLVESYGRLGLGKRMTGQLLSEPWGLFEHQGGSTWGGTRARLHPCVLHRGTSSLTSPVDHTWPPLPHIGYSIPRLCKRRVLNSTEHEERRHTVSSMLKLPPPAAVA